MKPYRRRTLYLVAAALLLESALILFLPSRLPRPLGFLTAGINAIAAAALWLLARQRN